MKKLKNKHGMTLMEVLAAILVLVFLVVGIGTGMDSGLRVYREVSFETDSATLADNIDTMLGDLLRHAVDVWVPEENQNRLPVQIPADATAVFTNTAFGAEDAYVHLRDSDGKLVMDSVRKNTPSVALINKGLYADLEVSDFQIQYAVNDDGSGQHFVVRYTIVSTIDPDKERTVETVIRHLNP